MSVIIEAFWQLEKKANAVSSVALFGGFFAEVNYATKKKTRTSGTQPVDFVYFSLFYSNCAYRMQTFV